MHNSTSRFAVAVLATAALVFLCANVGRAQKPTVTIAPRGLTVAALDTAPNSVTATPRTLDGVAQQASPVTWSSSAPSIATVTGLGNARHTATVVGLTPGSAWLIATWQTFPGTTHRVVCNGQQLVVLDLVTVRDSVLVTVTPPRTMITLANALDQNRQPIFDITLENYCIFPLERDKSGRYYTGHGYTISTNDTANGRRWNSSDCADTTVDPLRLTLPLPVPRIP